MPISVVWADDNKTAIRYIYDERWSISEFNNAYAVARNMVAQVDHRVDFIIDVRNSGVIPTGVIGRGNAVTTQARFNEGMTVIVGANPLIRSIFNLFSKLYGPRIEQSKFKFASTLDEADTILSYRDPRQ